MRAGLAIALCLGVAVAWNSLATEASSPSPVEVALRNYLLIRTSSDGGRYGAHDLDILFWDSTRHLLTEPSHSRALEVLDEFIANRSAQAMRDPVRRAWLQRDLWQLYDWTFEHSYLDEHDQRDAIRSRLAVVIRALAPDETQLAALPDNLAMLQSLQGGSDFPPGFEGEWVVVAREDAGAVAAQHMRSFGGRSTFNVMLRLPGGNEQARTYLKKLQAQLDDDFIADLPRLNFPAGTRWALVRTLNVIDGQGKIRATRWVESVQMRTYVDPSRQMPWRLSQEAAPQVFAEAHADRARLPELIVMGPEERAFSSVHFASHGIDPFEVHLHNPANTPDIQRARGVILRECVPCHQDAGLRSVRSILGFAQADQAQLQAVRLVEGSFERQSELTLEWKQAQANWKELRRLWSEAR